MTNPIPDVPAAQQRSISRADFDLKWPFNVGMGTLGCTAGAVLFRTGDVTYALNDAASVKGFPSPVSIQITVGTYPSNPLSRIKQDARMQISADASECRAGSTAASCLQRLRSARGLTEDELKQIDAEGVERHWPPLPPQRASVAPLVDEGLKLCGK